MIQNLSSSGTLDASGNSLTYPLNGITSDIRFSPTGTDWTVSRITVSCSSRVKEALCRIYVGYVGDMYEVGRTYSGSSGDTNTDEVKLTDGQTLHIVWTGGDPGAVCTANIRVTSDDPKGGFRAF